jgi:transposase
MDITQLLTVSSSIRISAIEKTPERMTVHAVSTTEKATCPRCHTPAQRVHSHYRRRARDLPWQGVAVRLELSVRRFFCTVPVCSQRIFCERLSFVAPHAHRTVRLNHALQRIRLAVGGEGGARLAGTLALPTSPDTLLRRLRQLPSRPAATPRVVGIDDWAKRKGRSYGTILVDLERRVPIELLPDREEATVRHWLETHPEVRIISRDRAPQYAEAARVGAPQAVQVVDRWHILKNLGEAVQRVLTRQRRQSEDAAWRMRAPLVTPSAAMLPLPSLSSTEASEIARHRANRYARYRAVKQLQVQGVSQHGIARTLVMSPNTVRRYVRASTFPERARYRSGSRLDAYLPYLHARWVQGVRNPTVLWQEIRTQGYPGTARMIERYIVRLYQRLKGLTTQQRAHFLQTALTFKAPTVRHLTAWLQRASQQLTAEQARFLTHLSALSPEIQEARHFALAFRRLLKKRLHAQFPTWLAQAVQNSVPELRSFAVGLRQEYAAVAAAFKYGWSNGPVEGHVNRLKTIKRQMYGRANFDLLQLRVLHAA